MKKPLVIIAGPTATGKSKYSVMFSKRHNGSVISADSMQVYKYMDIGSAKITKEEMQGVNHYLVDVLEPKEEFHVALFQQMAQEALDEIYEKNSLPVVCGGTGFYIQALLYGIDFSSGQENPALREKLSLFAKEQGAHALFERLKKVDPKSCETIHENNIKRVIRAIEYYEMTGEPISKHNEQEKEKESLYNYVFFVLNDDRKKLYEGIEKRVDLMVEMGLYDEVKRLYDMGYTKDYVSMQGLGYKEVLDAINGEISFDEAIYRIKRDTRHFAKRQITWFKREKDVIWIDKKEFDYDDEKILSFMEMECEKRNILC
ncbi:MAG: tRNA (adenosine(37)-N6)-dimethylallyltransferase MiaA [Lachnospiraceae bacterium]|nr:tRNA (adenosine(37)-N6)-dimethylallyltransferase MiaA [Lachnospiraceae bacterium]